MGFSACAISSAAVAVVPAVLRRHLRGNGADFIVSSVAAGSLFKGVRSVVDGIERVPRCRGVSGGGNSRSTRFPGLRPVRSQDRPPACPDGERLYHLQPGLTLVGVASARSEARRFHCRSADHDRMRTRQFQQRLQRRVLLSIVNPCLYFFFDISGGGPGRSSSSIIRGSGIRGSRCFRMEIMRAVPPQARPQ